MHDPPVDSRLRTALLRQLAARRELLAGGARHVGWKLGVGARERIDGSIAVGFLTSATVLGPGGTYAVGGADRDLRADVELAVELGADVDPRADASALEDLVSGYGTALEIVDLAPDLESPEAVVAANVFHRAVVFGRVRSTLPATTLRATARVNGDLRDAAAGDADFYARLSSAVRILDSVGERLRAGDRVITGSIVQVGVRAGDEVVGELAGLGSVRLAVTA